MAQPPKTELLTQIRDLIHNHFDLEELRELCFRLGIRYDDLPGETLSARTRELVLRLDRERRLDDLLNFCAHLRPKTEWPDLSVPVDLEAAPPSAAPERNPRQIFLSHARQDADFAHQLANDLRRHGWEIWLAPDSIRPGEKWVDAINRGLAESGVFLLSITPDAVRSKWVNSETSVAIDLEHENVLRFIPLAVKAADLPPLWRTYQRVSFQSDYKAGVEALWQVLQPEVMAELAGLYRQLQAALANREWQKAQTTAVQITVLYPDYRDTDDLLAKARQATADEEAQRVKADRLLLRLQTALEATDWDTALELARQIGALVPNYRNVNQLAEQARRGQRQSQRDAQIRWLRRIPFWGRVGGALVGMLALFLLFEGFGDSPTATPSRTPPPTSVAELLPIITADSPTVMPSHTPSPTVDPNLPPMAAQLGSEWTGPNGMVLVYVPPPEAPFVLASGVDAPTEGYWIAKYEVSNAQYQLCVAAGACEPSAFAEDDNFNGAEYPVVGVSWFDAAAYTTWLNETGAVSGDWSHALPTEAEWEYAAVGQTGTDYPWGAEFDGARLNFCDTNCPLYYQDTAWDDGYAYTAPVGSYPAGESWVGASDMSGNVWEWTGSWFNEEQNSRVVRGGSWVSLRLNARTALRHGYVPYHRLDLRGFRVVVGVRPPSP